MVDKINFTRNKKIDAEMIDTMKGNKKVFNIFTNASWLILFKLLKKLKINLIVVSVTSFLIASLEGIKAGIILLLISVAVATNQGLEKYQNIEYLNWFININNYFQLDFRIYLIFSILFLLILLIIISSSAKIFIAWLTEKLTAGLLRIVRKEALRKLFSFDIRYFSQAKSGELLFLMTSETNRFSVLINLFVSSLTLFIQFLIFYVMLLFMLWQFTLLITLIGLIYFLIHIRIDKHMRILSWTQNLSMNSLSQFFHELIYGIKIIKIAGLEDRQTNQYFNKHKELEKIRVKAGLIGGISNAFQDIFLFLSLIIVLFLIIKFYGFNYIALNSQIFLGFLFLLIRTLPVLINLQKSRSNLINAYGPLNRVMDLLSLKVTNLKSRKNILSREVNISEHNLEKISINNISFSYNDKKILQISNHTFHKNKLIAIVGYSGSGKSTLLDLLSNLLVPQKGNIFVNEFNMNDIDLLSFKNILGYMNQEPIVFHDSIRNNVDFFKQNSTDEEIWHSLKLSESFDFVNELENKIDHGIGERGQTLSGGQKQRIGLSRIFLQDPKLILLDEATNALDFQTEKNIYDNLKKISKERIVIVVAHRLSALINFDEIIVLNAGKIVEVGKHEKLIINKGIYYDMFNAQIKIDNLHS